MSRIKESFMYWNEQMGFGDGYPRCLGRTQKHICKCCGIATQDVDMCQTCADLVEESRRNFELGLCPVCKGSCCTMDGTTCPECNGTGLY